MIVAEGSLHCPTQNPPTYSPYPTTPKSSLDGVHDSTTDVSAVATVLTSVGALGGVTSRQAAVDTNVDLCLERFPAPSNASTPTVYPVLQARLRTVYAVLAVSLARDPFRYTP